MNNKVEAIAGVFEAQRSQLRALAYRMLGSLAEADDAVQEAWLRLNRSDVEAIENLNGWLRTVVAKLCLDTLRSRKSRRHESLEERIEEPAPHRAAGADPEEEALLADSVGVALLVVLDALPPAERVAFVLHDVFDVSFEEIANIVGRNEAAARQLASRARRRVRGKTKVPNAVLREQRMVVDRFLAALRAGDVDALLSVLDPELVVRADSAARAPGAPAEIRGARNWASGAIAFSRFVRFMQPALLNGTAGLVFAPGGRLARALRFTMEGGRIREISIIADPAALRELEMAVLSNR